MQSDYISIREFAELAGVSQQSIYKRLQNKNDELQPFYKKIDGKKYISLSALAAIYKIESQPQEQPKEESSNGDSFLLMLLQQQLEAMQRDVEEKNKQIQNLNDRLAEANQIISQQQQLHLLDKQKLIALEAAAALEETHEEAAAAEESQNKKSIFDIFKKRKR